jgi:hypothetical protein
VLVSLALAQPLTRHAAALPTVHPPDNCWPQAVLNDLQGRKQEHLSGPLPPQTICIGMVPPSVASAPRGILEIQ